MNFSTAALTAILPMTSGAAPHPQLIHEIERSYNPKIEFHLVSSGRSLYGCAIEDFEITGQDPVTLKTRSVSVSLYRTRAAREKQDMVIILPPTGGVNILDKGYANELCSAGLTVALIASWDHQDETTLEFNMHDNGALRALAATRHVTEFLQMERPSSIGILGTSIGAVAGALVLGLESRISSAALIVGSARFADVIAESDEAGATRLRRQRIKALGLRNADEYRQAVRKAVRIEPSDFTGYSGKKRALVVSADRDVTVPSQYQFELAQLLQAETYIQLSGNHLQVIKDTFCQHRKDIVNFFLKRQDHDQKRDS